MLQEAEQCARKEGLPAAAAKALQDMNLLSLERAFDQIGSEPFAREFLPWLNRRWREGVPLFPCNLKALLQARTLMPEAFWSLMERRLGSQGQQRQPVLLEMLVRDGKSLGGLQEKEEDSPEMTSCGSSHSAFF